APNQASHHIPTPGEQRSCEVNIKHSMNLWHTKKPSSSIGGRGHNLFFFAPVVVPPPFTPRGASAGSAERKPPHYNGCAPKSWLLSYLRSRAILLRPLAATQRNRIARLRTYLLIVNSASSPV